MSAAMEAGVARASGGRMIAIDGKALRRSTRKRQGMLHLVTALSCDNGLTLAQVACDDKPNEITAIPELMKLFQTEGLYRDHRCDGLPERDCPANPRPEGAQCPRAEGESAGTGSRHAAGLLGRHREQLRRHETRGHHFDGEVPRPPRRTGVSRDRDSRRDQPAVGVRSAAMTGPACARWPSSSRTAKSRVKNMGSLACTSAACRPKINLWPTRSTNIGRSRTASTGCWTSPSMKIHAANKTATVERTSPPTLSLLRQDTSLKCGVKAKRFACAFDPNYLLQIFQQSKINA